MRRFGSKNSRNFGFGKQIWYAGRKALQESYKKSSYSTVASHAQRWHIFCDWLKLEYNIKDTRKITQAIFDAYGQSVKTRLKSNKLKVSYAQNLICSVNVTLKLLRGDKKIYLSPAETVGKRCHVKQEPPLSEDIDRVIRTCDELKQSGFYIAAAILMAVRTFGMREKEAVLMNYKRALRQAKKTGKLNVTMGTKGGRGRRIDRFIEVSSSGMNLLYELSQLQGHKQNLIPDGMNWKQIDDALHIKEVKTIFNNNDLKFYHDARAAYACDRYYELTGNNAPVITGNKVQDKKKDKMARKIISQELGHSRSNIMVSYIGSAV